VASGVTVELSGRWKVIQSLINIHDLRKTLNTVTVSMGVSIMAGPPDAGLYTHCSIF
jgi:hypothetical protein